MKGEAFDRKEEFEVKHIRIVGEIDYMAKTFSSSTTISLQLNCSTPTIILDAIDFIIRTVRVGNEITKYSYNGRKITVIMPENIKPGTVDITVDYTVSNPPLGLYFITKDKYGDHVQPQVWTLGEGQTDDFRAQEDNSYWFPYIQGPGVKSTSETIITVEKPQEVISNGILVGVNESSHKRTFHWKMDKPHSLYLISIVAGEFDKEEETIGKVKLMYFVPKGQKAHINRTFSVTKDIFSFYEDYTGIKYPHDKFSQTCVYEATFGGMENTTANTMTERTLHDEIAHMDFSSEENVGHHMAHQWFGDLVTCGTWEDVWLNEGLAAFLYAMYVKMHHGESEYMYHLLDKLDNFLKADDSRGVSAVYPIHNIDPKRAFDRFNSEKGALVMCSLETFLGPESIKKAIQSYFEKHIYGTALTVDFLNLLNESTGIDVTWFFDQYIYAAGYPILEYTYSYDEINKILGVRFRQIQKIPRVFRLNFNLSLGSEGGSIETYPVTISEKDEIRKIFIEKAPDFICVDPDLSVVGKIITPVFQDLIAKIKFDPHVTCKIRAIRSIGSGADSEVVSSLSEILSAKTEHWAVSSEAAAALGRICMKSSLKVLEENLTHSDPKVRRSIFRSLGLFPGDDVRDTLRRSLEIEESYYIKGEILNSLGRTGTTEDIGLFIKAMSQPSHEDTIALGAIRGLGEMGTDGGIGVLLNIVNSVVARKKLKIAAIKETSRFLSNNAVKNELIRLIDSEDKELRDTAFGIALKSDDEQFRVKAKDKFIGRYYKESHSATLV